MRKAELGIHPLSPFGAEVAGIDLRQTLDSDVQDRLRDAWDEHALLLFRKQELSTEQCDRAVQIFGEISYEGGYGRRMYVSNVAKDGVAPRGELLFHTDFSFYERPLRGIVLYAIEVPPEGAGGDTLFADAKLAWEHLSGRMQDRLRDLKITHSTSAIPIEEQPPEVMSATHSVAFHHPKTGATVLFCSPRHFKQFEGLGPEEGASLCREIEAELKKPDIILRHVWRPGDWVVFDNIRLQHARTDFDPSLRRHLRRTQIGAPVSALA